MAHKKFLLWDMYDNYQVFISKGIYTTIGYTPISSHRISCRLLQMLQCYIKRFGKNVTAADSLKQFVCSDTEAVGT